MISTRARELNVPLCLAPTITNYKDINSNDIELGLKGDVQYLNSSLAIQIAKYWIEKRENNILDKYKWVEANTAEILSINDYPILNIPILKSLKINNNFKNGLEKCFWPGRNQIIESNNITYYIDGAHTVESIEQFFTWFMKLKQNNNKKEKNVLLFNYTGDRDSLHFLEKLCVR